MTHTLAYSLKQVLKHAKSALDWNEAQVDETSSRTEILIALTGVRYWVEQAEKDLYRRR